MSFEGLFVGDPIRVFPPAPLIDPQLPKTAFARLPESADVPASLVSVETRGGSRAAAQIDVLEPGTLVDRYRIERLLGAGGFGAVYLAVHSILNSSFALKVLRRRILKTQRSRVEELYREARIAARIDHHHVVRVFDVVEHADLAYLVLEYVGGGSLSDLIRAQGPLSAVRAIEVARDIVAGLAAGLSVGVIHRDIKPGNILMSKAGAKVTDFGLAMLHDLSEGKQRSGGTPGYVSPEQAARSTVDHRSDIYSLGVTLFESITGVSPRKASGRRADVPPEPLPVRDHSAGVDAELVDLIESMVDFDPNKRPKTYQELDARLESLLRRLRMEAQSERNSAHREAQGERHGETHGERR
jgi:serine/threonine protein kinase